MHFLICFINPTACFCCIIDHALIFYTLFFIVFHRSDRSSVGMLTYKILKVRPHSRIRFGTNQIPKVVRAKRFRHFFQIDTKRLIADLIGENHSRKL